MLVISSSVAVTARAQEVSLTDPGLNSVMCAVLAKPTGPLTVSE